MGVRPSGRPVGLSRSKLPLLTSGVGHPILPLLRSGAHPSPYRGRIFVVRIQPQVAAQAGDELGQGAVEKAVEVERLGVEQAFEVELQIDEAAAVADRGVALQRVHDGRFRLGALLAAGLVAQAARAVEVRQGGQAPVDAVLQRGRQADRAADLGEGAGDLVEPLRVGQVVGDGVGLGARPRSRPGAPACARATPPSRPSAPACACAAPPAFRRGERGCHGWRVRRTWELSL